VGDSRLGKLSFPGYDVGMDKRYQVFVSSTYEDLREERAAVMTALLNLDCFPAGMELFPAADEDSLTLIKRVIEESDYYLLLLGGRYGTCPPGEERSYTHLEYDYALEVGKPTIALLHGSPKQLPLEKSENSEVGREKLAGFREKVQQKHCKKWVNLDDLTNAVYTGVTNLKKTRPGSGWVKGPAAGEEGLKDELLRSRREVEALREELALAQSRLAPVDVSEFAQGSDEVAILIELVGDFDHRRQLRVNLSWNLLMRAILPLTFGGGTNESRIVNAIDGVARSESNAAIWSGWNHSILRPSELSKVLNQMVALGLIHAVCDPHRVGETIWRATPYGEQSGARLLAIKRTSEVGVVERLEP
jgi:hypothetical protein